MCSPSLYRLLPSDVRSLPLQALTQDKMRSAASAEMAITTESVGESELSDEDFVSLAGSSLRGSYADASFEPSISARHDLPQVPARIMLTCCLPAARDARVVKVISP